MERLQCMVQHESARSPSRKTSCRGGVWQGSVLSVVRACPSWELPLHPLHHRRLLLVAVLSATRYEHSPSALCQPPQTAPFASLHRQTPSALCQPPHTAPFASLHRQTPPALCQPPHTAPFASQPGTLPVLTDSHPLHSASLH